jgi:hypothetical protein
MGGTCCPLQNAPRTQKWSAIKESGKDLNVNTNHECDIIKNAIGIPHLLSIGSSFMKQVVEALLEDLCRKLSALPDKAATAVYDHARGGKRLFVGLEREISHASELHASDAKSLLVRFFQIRQHCD